MPIDHFIARVWRFLSIIGFAITLLFVYRGLPNPTAVHFGPSGRGDGYLPKDQIFYLLSLVMTAFNVLAIMMIRSLERFPKAWFEQKIPLFAPKGGEVLRQVFLNFLHFLPAIINTYLVFVLRALLLLNDERTFAQNVGYLIPLAIVLLLLWLIYPILRLLMSGDVQEED